MTKISFYFNVLEIDSLTQKISNEVVDNKLGAIILVADGLGELLNRKLWQRPQLAFITHCLPEYPQVKNIPFLVCESSVYNKILNDDSDNLLDYTAVYANSKSEIQKRSVLINLDGEPMPYFSSFAKVFEIVPNPELLTHSAYPAPDKAIVRARDRFRFYRERGYEIDTEDALKK